jgi:hypothetical protein
MRTVGCCSHNAAIIYYFSHGKYLDSIPNPSSRLTTIFPINDCDNSKKEKSSSTKKDPNELKIKKVNRRKNNNKSSCASDDSSDYSSQCSDIYDCIVSSDLNNPSDDSSDDLSGDSSDESSDSETKSIISCGSLNELNRSMKRLLSTDTEDLNLKKRMKTRFSGKIHNTASLDLSNFKLRISNWGGKIVDEMNNELGFKIVDTCTIDYFLLAIWTCKKLNNQIIDKIMGLLFSKKQHLIDIINSVEDVEWNKAKSVWILRILFDDYVIDCNCDECIIVFPLSKTISTFGAEYEFLLGPIIEIQKYSFISYCSHGCNLNGLSKESVALTFEKQSNKVDLLFTNKNVCRTCKKKKNVELSNFIYNPPWIFVQTNESEIYVNEIPKILLIGVKNYQFLCATIHSKNHFRAIFDLNNEFFLIDDLNPSKLNRKIPKLKIVTCFYYSID